MAVCVHRVQTWRSPKRARWNLYQHPNRLVRWYFWRRLEVALGLSSPVRRGVALDIGCGEGFFLPSLAGEFELTLGLDINEKVVDEEAYDPSVLGKHVLDLTRGLVVTECGAEASVSILAGDALALPLSDNTVDVVFCLDAIEHMPDPRRLLGEVYRVLKPEGRFIATMPVEKGMPLLLRQVNAWALNVARERYTVRDLLAAVFGRVEPGRVSCTLTHKGYDYWADLKLIETLFTITSVRYIPFHGLGWLSPTVGVLAIKEACKPGIKGANCAL